MLREGLDRYLQQDVEEGLKDVEASMWTQARRAFMSQMRRRPDAADARKTNGLQRMFIQSADSKNLTRQPGMNTSELFAALGELGLSPTEEELGRLLKMSDVNFDGLIDFEEFKGMVYFLAATQNQGTPSTCFTSTEVQKVTHKALAATWSSGRNSSWMLNSAVEKLAGSNGTLDLKLFKPEVEPMVDALLYEPIPYRSAIEQGCTHVLVLRSYPDGRRMPQGYLGLFERLVAPKCLDPFPAVKDYMISLKHSERYSEDILRLNQGVAPAFAEADEFDDAVQASQARYVLVYPATYVLVY